MGTEYFDSIEEAFDDCDRRITSDDGAPAGVVAKAVRGMRVLGMRLFQETFWREGNEKYRDQTVNLWDAISSFLKQCKEKSPLDRRCQCLLDQLEIQLCVLYRRVLARLAAGKHQTDRRENYVRHTDVDLVCASKRARLFYERFRSAGEDDPAADNAMLRILREAARYVTEDGEAAGKLQENLREFIATTPPSSAHT